jgi:hypothetical protein
MRSPRSGVFALRALLPALAFSASFACAAPPGPAPVHGESDAFITQGVAVAWAILRAANPEDATVVIRIARDAGRLPGLGVVAIDPFSGESRTLREPSPAPATFDLPSVRRRFADFPRTEFRLYAAPMPGASAPALTLYYVGVPDTTPEFDSEAKLHAWLEGRMARLRAAPEGKFP